MLVVEYLSVSVLILSLLAAGMVSLNLAEGGWIEDET